MFDNYVVAKKGKPKKWVVALLTFSIAVHVVAVVALMIRSFWMIEKVAVPDTESSISTAPPPPPPPPPGGKKKPDNVEKKKVKKVEAAEVQPNKIKEEQKVTESEDEGEEGGVEGGVAGGVAGGVLGGVEGGVLGGTGDAPPPPPKPEKPQIVQQTALEASRISGDKNIQPPDTVKTQISRDGKNRVMAVVKMCLTEGGSVKSLNVIKSSGYDAYDRQIKAKMNQWKYRPFKVNGKAVPVCSAITFIYTQS